MGLDIGTTDGDFTPWVKYNAKAGRWYVKGETGDVEVQNPIFVTDFANIQTGWFYFSPGSAPERVMDASLTQRAPKPDRNYVDKTTGKTRDCFSRGFAVNLFSNDHFGGVVELSATSAILCGAIDDLYDLYEAAPESKQGMLPVVQFVQAEAITGKHGTNYKPVFSIVKWIPRPVEFDTQPAQQAVQPVEAAAAPVATQAAVVQPVAAVGGVSEF